MLNVYPWGISLNVVVPLAPDRTRVLFRGYTWETTNPAPSAGDALDLVEMQDEAVVESVQRGVCARLYKPGRYAPAHEAGVHAFHTLLARALG
jgi:choline monooxygenase